MCFTFLAKADMYTVTGQKEVKMSEFVPGTKIPKPTVTLDDGNAFSIIGKVKKALQRAGCSAEVCQAFSDEAKSGDYDNVIQTAMKYADV